MSGRGSSISFELKDPSFYPSIIKDNPLKITNAKAKEVFPRSIADDEIDCQNATDGMQNCSQTDSNFEYC